MQDMLPEGFPYHQFKSSLLHKGLLPPSIQRAWDRDSPTSSDPDTATQVTLTPHSHGPLTFLHFCCQCSFFIVFLHLVKLKLQNSDPQGEKPPEIGGTTFFPWGFQIKNEIFFFQTTDKLLETMVTMQHKLTMLEQMKIHMKSRPNTVSA